MWLGCGGQWDGKVTRFGHRLEGADAAPPRHQQEEAEVDERADLRDVVAGRRRRLRAEVAEGEEEDHEDAVDVLVPVGPVADRLDRAAVEPGQEEQDQHRAAHHDDAPELGVEGLEQEHGDDGGDGDRDLGQRAEAAAQDRQHRADARG